MHASCLNVFRCGMGSPSCWQFHVDVEKPVWWLSEFSHAGGPVGNRAKLYQAKLYLEYQNMCFFKKAFTPFFWVLVVLQFSSIKQVGPKTSTKNPPNFIPAVININTHTSLQTSLYLSFYPSLTSFPRPGAASPPLWVSRLQKCICR